MAPRVRVTKEEIVKAAVEIVRESGEGFLNARSIAARLGCSTQPVFSNFETMEQLRLAVVQAAEELSGEYIERETQSGKWPPYKAGGMAYIRFAREERELFKLLYMGGKAPEDSESNRKMKGLVRQNTGLGEDGAKLFHLEMWAFVHGIAAMAATGYLELEEELISRMLTDCYQGLRLRFEGK